LVRRGWRRRLRSKKYGDDGAAEYIEADDNDVDDKEVFFVRGTGVRGSDDEIIEARVLERVDPRGVLAIVFVFALAGDPLASWSAASPEARTFRPLLSRAASGGGEIEAAGKCRGDVRKKKGEDGGLTPDGIGIPMPPTKASDTGTNATQTTTKTKNVVAAIMAERATVREGAAPRRRIGRDLARYWRAMSRGSAQSRAPHPAEDVPLVLRWLR